MKRQSFIAWLLLAPVCTVISAQTDTLPDGLGSTISTPEGLRALIERQDQRFVIVDVRAPGDYAAGHIPTAINIPDGLTASLTDAPAKDRYLVLYCLGGYRSPVASEKLLADGYRHIYVWGGISRWPFPRETSPK